MKKITNEDFIHKSNIKHNYKYSYPDEYIKSRIKINILCPKHGLFPQRPNDHLGGQGCPICNNRYKKQLNVLINRFNIIHNNKYDYSLFKAYKNQSDKIIIICPVHGEIKQQINNHLNGKGCKYCSKNVKKNNDILIKESNLVHNNFYDYSIIKYIDAKTPIEIICPKHGEFEQSPNSHLSGHGCPKCNESKGERKIRNILENNNIFFDIQKKFKNCKYIYMNCHLIFIYLSIIF